MSKLREERIEILKNLAKQDGGLITTAQIENAGISRVLIPTFIEEGVLVKERHGTYYYADEFPDDLLLIQKHNPRMVYSYGTERFLDACVDVGIQGLILPDIPFEEKSEFDPACKARGLALVSLIAPTSEDRIGRIAREAEGFVYCVSSLGVTGVRAEITTDIAAMVRLVKREQDIPCAVGFGISTPEQAKKMAAQADGVIVGSAIMKLIAAHGRDAVPHVAAYVKSMKDAIR